VVSVYKSQLSSVCLTEGWFSLERFQRFVTYLLFYRVLFIVRET